MEVQLRPPYNDDGTCTFIQMTSLECPKTAKFLLNFALIQARELFSCMSNNTLLLALFVANEIFTDLEADELEAVLTPMAWGKRFLKLIETCSDPVTALHLLCNLNDSRLNNCQTKFNDVFKRGTLRLIENKVLNSKCNVAFTNPEQRSNEQGFGNKCECHFQKPQQQSATNVEFRNSWHGKTKGWSPQASNSVAVSQPIMQNHEYKCKKSVDKEYYAESVLSRQRLQTPCNLSPLKIYAIIVGQVLVLAIILVWFDLGRNENAMLKIARNSVERTYDGSPNITPNTSLHNATEGLSKLVGSFDKISTLERSSTSESPPSTQNEIIKMITSWTAVVNKVKMSNLTGLSQETKIVDNSNSSSYFTSKPLQEHKPLVVNHPNDFGKIICDHLNVDQEVILNIDFSFDWNYFTMDCPNPVSIFTLSIIGSPSIKTVHKILNHALLIRNLKILTCDKITNIENFVAIGISKVQLNLLTSLEILSGDIASSCNTILLYLAQHVFFQLSKLTIHGVSVTQDNEKLISYIFTQMVVEPISITLENVVLDTELNIRNEHLILANFSLSIHNSSQGSNNACDTLRTVLIKAAYNAEVLTDVPNVTNYDCQILKGKYRLVVVKDLTLVANVRNDVQTFRLDFLQTFPEIENFEITLRVLKYKDFGLPLLIVEGIQNLSSHIKMLRIKSNFEVNVSGASVYCQVFYSQKDGNDFVNICSSFSEATRTVKRVSSETEKTNSESSTVKAAQERKHIKRVRNLPLQASLFG